ncbi:MAG TPA: FKBP-type peptidyl-prolyl cis-trans isomerase [Myxococcota bacterium]|nr:FKBP-type peptidyl-prolyl cis-trans isomerase [Myxococcota bacterium]
MIPRIAAAALLACMLSAAPGARAQQPETEEQKTIYAIGLAVARNLRSFDLSPDEIKLMEAGLTAGLTGAKPAVDFEAYEPKLDSLAKSRNEARTKREKDASSAFLKTAAAVKGAQTRPSGVIYRELRAGTGDHPTTKDNVKVQYTGKLRDGRVFDSSVERGKPADFPLNRMIPCWQEALPLMRVGGKAEISCPSDTAYGDSGVPPGTGDRVPPGAALSFEIELLGIEKGASTREKLPQTPNPLTE